MKKKGALAPPLGLRANSPPEDIWKKKKARLSSLFHKYPAGVRGRKAPEAGVIPER
jgi:hypothetical protein